MIKKLLFYYSAIVTLLITVSSGKFVFLFLPILAYFLLSVTKLVIESKLLTYYGFVVSTLMVATSFLSAKSPIDFAAASLFSPLLIYFILKVIPKRNRAIVLAREDAPLPVQHGKVDIDRRMFLKAIASAGISVFLFAIFTKKAEAAFFGSVPGPGTVSLKDSAGNKIDPAEKHPTDGYKLTEFDDSGTYTYAGYLKKDSSWFILRDNGTSYRYAEGATGFASNWTNKGDLTYYYYDEVFGS